jgi:hypothetical protein
MDISVPIPVSVSQKKTDKAIKPVCPIKNGQTGNGDRVKKKLFNFLGMMRG